MKQLNLSLESRNGAKYLQISAALRDAIRHCQVLPSEQLPSARELAAQLNTNRHTIMAAYAELIAEGWIESIERRGYFVNRALPIETSTHSAEVTNNSTPFQWRFTKTLFPTEKNIAANFQYNFAGGNPDINLFPFKEFKNHLNDAMSRPDLVSLNYGNNQGFEPLIKQIKIYLRRARSLNHREIVVTNGSQEALYILAQILLSRGDAVATEAMGYRPAWRAFLSSGATLVGIDQDEHGMIPSSLEQAISAHHIKMIYLTPLHQYPTTVTLPIARRMAIYKIAASHQIAIIEDDYDHEFHYRCQPLAPMASDDPQGLVIYISTFSKIMYPGVRLGFIAVDKTLAQAIVSYRTLINHKVSITQQDALARWMASGEFERYLRKITKIYQQRRDFMCDELKKYINNGKIINFKQPDGGMAIWINVGSHAKQLVKYAVKNQVFIQDQAHFQLDPISSQNHHIRLGFSGMCPQKIKKGLKIIFNHGN